MLLFTINEYLTYQVTLNNIFVVFFFPVIFNLGGKISIWYAKKKKKKVYKF